MNTKFIGFDRLKQAVSIEQVLERYGLLEMLRRSGDSMSGACPMHGGHNPTAFRASLSLNCWTCFGDCHCGGSIVDFVSRIERVGIRKLVSRSMSLHAVWSAMKLSIMPCRNSKSVCKQVGLDTLAAKVSVCV